MAVLDLNAFGGQPAEVAEAAAPTPVAATPPVVDHRKQAMDFFTDPERGWTKEQAAGIVGNLIVESGDFDPDVLSGKRRGDAGKAFGVAQWHPDRQASFQGFYGKPIGESSYNEQLQFIHDEMTKGRESRAGEKLRSATTPEQAAELFDKFYERSSGEAREQRMKHAADVFGAHQGAAVTPAEVTPSVGGRVIDLSAFKRSAQQPTQQEAPFGLRQDGTPKGTGFLGILKRPDGNISTEISIGVNFDGKETEIPTLVPTLTQQEIDYLLSGARPTDIIIRKAIDHARQRMGQGLSPFAAPAPAGSEIEPSEEVPRPEQDVLDAFGGATFLERVQSFPGRLSDAVTSYVEEARTEARAKLPEVMPKPGTPEYEELTTREVTAPLTEVLPQAVLGVTDFMFVKPTLLGITGVTTVLENIGIMDKTTPKEKKQWRDEIEQGVSTFGGLIESKTATGVLGMKALEAAMSPIVKFVESRKAALGADAEFAEKYPNLNDALQFGGEVLAFGAIPGIKQRLKKIEKKTGKARDTAEQALFDKIEKAIPKTEGLPDLIAERRAKNQQAIAGAEGISAFDIPNKARIAAEAKQKATEAHAQMTELVESRREMNQQLIESAEGITAIDVPNKARLVQEAKMADQQMQALITERKEINQQLIDSATGFSAFDIARPRDFLRQEQLANQKLFELINKRKEKNQQLIESAEDISAFNIANKEVLQKADLEATQQMLELVDQRIKMNQQILDSSESFSAFDVPNKAELLQAERIMQQNLDTLIQQRLEMNQQLLDSASGFSAINIPNKGEILKKARQAQQELLGYIDQRIAKNQQIIDASEGMSAIDVPNRAVIEAQKVAAQQELVKLTETRKQMNQQLVDAAEGFSAIGGPKGAFADLMNPLRNEEGAIRIPTRRKDVLENVPESVKEKVRVLGKTASDQGKSFEGFLKEAGFDKAEIKQMQKLQDVVALERPLKTRTVEPMEEGTDPFVLREGEANVNTVPGANPKTVIPARVLEQAQGAKRTITSGIRRGFEPTIYALEKFKAPFLKDLWHKSHAIEAARIKDLDTLKGTVLDLRKTYPSRKLREEAFAKIMAQDPLGAEALKQMGVKAPVGEIAYEGLVLELQQQFKDLFDRVNETRKSIGKTPVKERENYLPMIAQEHFYNQIAKMFHGKKGEAGQPNLVLDSAGMINDRHSVPTVEATNFRHLKRKGLTKGTKLESDPLKLLSIYGATALKHTHYSPLNMFVNQLTTNRWIDPKTGKRTWKMDAVNPELHAYLSRWSNKLAGRPNVASGPAMKFVERGMEKLSNNLTAAMLGWSMRTVLVQPTAMLPTATEFGLRGTMKGLIGTAARGKGEPIGKSNVLSNRVADAFINDLVSHKLDGTAKRIATIPAELAFEGMRFVDQVAAEATWRTAFNSVKKDMGERGAIRFADEAVVRTQGSGFAGDLSPIQMNALGKTITLWQTFTINHMNWIAREVLNIKHPERSPVETGRRVLYYMVGTAMINSLFEDQLGIQSPQPAPIKEILRSRKEGDPGVVAIYKGLLELTEMLPIISSMKFGSSPGGAVVEFLNEVNKAAADDVPRALAGDREAAKRVAFTAAKLTGVPGTQQVKRFTQGSPLGYQIGQKKRGKVRNGASGFKGFGGNTGGFGSFEGF